jgi:hypothetical protein
MKTKKILILALAIGAFSACRKGDDLYINPNAPAAATPATLLTGVEANTTMNYEAGIARTVSLWMQHNSGIVAQYQQYDDYDLQSSDMDNYWTGLYVGAMKNAKLLFDQYEATYPYYGGIAKVNMAINLGIATELWGDVPYSEAWKFEAGVSMPHMDAQKNILASIQTLLDQAIADFSKPASANQQLPAGDDVIFNGSASKWKKTAYVLKARYHNLLSKSDPSGSAANVIADLANGMTSLADNCLTSHNTSADQNQWGAFQEGRGYMSACQTLIDSMGGSAPGVGGTPDPRLFYYFDSTGWGNMIVGNQIGQTTGGSTLGNYLYDVDLAASGGSGTDRPSPLVTYTEQLFLLAEAQVRSGDAVNGAITLNLAIKASVTDVTSGTSTSGPITYTAANTDIHAVILEKWKAMFGQPLEAYADYRRTGWPKLKVNPFGVRNYIPQRFPTDLAEQTSNTNAVSYQLNIPVWFAQ